MVMQASLGGAFAQRFDRKSVEKLNKVLAGRIVDYTANHGFDNQFPSKILGGKRDMYVYLPPHYDSCRAYPLLLWLHGGFGDEHAFLDSVNVPALDQMIQKGCCPPFILVCPDGTYRGRDSLFSTHSFYANGRGGRFEDHIMCEVLPFLMSRYRILPQREAHVVAGVSAGGTGAMSMALYHRDFFSGVASVSGGLNLMYDNLDHDFFQDFSPLTYRWKAEYQPREVIGKFAKNLIRVKAQSFIRPVFGENPGIEQRIIRWNPAHVLSSTNLQPGELAMFIRYGKKDNLNFDAQNESFIWLARQRRIHIDVEIDPEGYHDIQFFKSSSPAVYRWVGRHFQNILLK